MGVWGIQSPQHQSPHVILTQTKPSVHQSVLNSWNILISALIMKQPRTGLTCVTDFLTSFMKHTRECTCVSHGFTYVWRQVRTCGGEHTATTAGRKPGTSGQWGHPCLGQPTETKGWWSTSLNASWSRPARPTGLQVKDLQRPKLLPSNFSLDFIYKTIHV